ncbi:MAG: hypothetical protein Q8R14_04540 [Candidatus Omnitrophota bacterium]|nr:hypothetical protein [Candidatus Omnitrophota bacterium]
MKRLIFLPIILMSIAVAAAVSADEVTLTTILPDPSQTVLQGKKGAVGATYSSSTTLPDASIPASSLLVEGNIGVGATSPLYTPKTDASHNSGGNIDANDVWIRTANTWASTASASKIYSAIGLTTVSTSLGNWSQLSSISNINLSASTKIFINFETVIEDSGTCAPEVRITINGTQKTARRIYGLGDNQPYPIAISWVETTPADGNYTISVDLRNYSGLSSETIYQYGNRVLTVTTGQ